MDPDSGRLDIEQLKLLLNDKVKLVAVTHCSNVVGEINPIKEISSIFHDNNSLLITD